MLIWPWLVWRMRPGPAQVDAGIGDSSHHPVPAEQLGEPLLVAKPVLKGEQKRTVVDERPDQSIKVIVGRRFERDQNEVCYRKLRRVVVDVKRTGASVKSPSQLSIVKPLLRTTW